MFNKKLKVQRSQTNTVCYRPPLLFHPVSPAVAFSSRPPPHQVHRSEENVICKLEHKSVYVREVCLAEVTSAQAVFALNHINLKCPFSCLLSKESFSIDCPHQGLCFHTLSQGCRIYSHSSSPWLHHDIKLRTELVSTPSALYFSILWLLPYRSYSVQSKPGHITLGLKATLSFNCQDSRIRCSCNSLCFWAQLMHLLV